MLESNDRKLALCGWLQRNYPDVYQSPEKLQVFLFLYEGFPLANDEPADQQGLVLCAEEASSSTPLNTG